MTLDPHHCITCSDEGVQLTVLRVEDDGEMARCRDESGTETAVQVALVADVLPGDTLLVHAGTALLRVRLTEQVRA